MHACLLKVTSAMKTLLFLGLLKRPAGEAIMYVSKLQVTYDGNQHCTALQEKKGKTVNMGKGEDFSPWELVGAGLAGCMFWSMGTSARINKLDISGACVDVEVSMAPTRIQAIDLTFTLPRNFSKIDRAECERAAGRCPIKRSIHPDIRISVRFNYPE